MSASNPIYQQDGLYQLLPAIYRNRDAELGYPLQALLRAIGLQVQQLAADIDQQYENWFIETCEDALLPYFAQLVALDVGPALPTSAASPAADANAAWRRREVADAIADRRRKGSFAVLEQLAFDATGWPARAVDYGAVLLQTRSARFPQAGGVRLPDLRTPEALDVLSSAAAPLADVRSLSAPRSPGSGGPGRVAVWLWRLLADRVRHAPARVGAEPYRYLFDQLGRDQPLAVVPTARTAGTPPVLDLDVPVPISRVALADRLEDYYGPGRCICIYRGGEPVPREKIVVADLAGWHRGPEPGHIAIDPERGRIAFPSRHPPDDDVAVSYARLTVGAIGGGSYERTPALAPDGATVYAVGEGAGLHRTIGAALAAWNADREKTPAMPTAVIEIRDDGVYEERLSIELYPGEQLVIRAADGCRPVVVPTADRADHRARLLVTGRVEPRQKDADKPARRQAKPKAPAAGPALLTLDGLWIAGGPLELRGHFSAVAISHCTLVPAAGSAQLQDERDHLAPSLVAEAMPCPLSISSSVVGRIEVDVPESGHDPLPLQVSDSVLDASRRDGRALLGVDERRAYVSLGLERVTVLGGADVHDVSLVENSILTGHLLCERRQTGRVRFSYFHPGSRTPRPTRCEQKVTPRFDGERFGDPAYARLAIDTAAAILRGADDGGELGAYHNLWQALAIDDLRARLTEFSPAGIEIDIRFAS